MSTIRYGTSSDDFYENGIPNAPDPAQPVVPPALRTDKKRKKIIGVATFLTILAIVITILASLYAVHYGEEITMLPVSVDNSTLDITPVGFSLPVVPVVQAVNKNFFTIYLDSVDVKSFHPLYANGTVDLGSANVKNIVIPGRKTTHFDFPFLIHFNRTFDPELSYFSAILANCSLEVDPRLYMAVSVKVDYHMWAKSGSINEVHEMSVPCPVSKEEATRVQNIVSGINSFG